MASRLIQDFMLPALRNKTFGENLKWDPDDKSVFMLKWIHKAKSSWSQHDAAVFLAWDKIKHRPKPKTHLDFVNSKQRLRAALRNVKTVREVMPLKGYRRYKILAMANLFRNDRKVKKEPDDAVDIKSNVEMEDGELPLQFPIKIKQENITEEKKEGYENIETKYSPIKLKKVNRKKERNVEYENMEATKYKPVKVKEENTEEKIGYHENIETRNKMYLLRDRSVKRVVYYQSESEEEFGGITDEKMPNEDKVIQDIIKKEPNDVKTEIEVCNAAPEDNYAVTKNEKLIVSVSKKKDDFKSPVRFEKARKLSETKAKKISVEDLSGHKGLKRSSKRKRAKAVKSCKMSHRSARFGNAFYNNSSILNQADQRNAGSLGHEEKAIPMTSPVYRGENRKNIKQKYGSNNLVSFDQKFDRSNSKMDKNSVVKLNKNRTVQKDLPLNNSGIIGQLSDTPETGASSEMKVRDARERSTVASEKALPVSKSENASKGGNESAERNEAESAPPDTGKTYKMNVWYATKWPPERLSNDGEDIEAERGIHEEPYPNFFDPETELTALLEYAYHVFLHPMTEKDIADYMKYLEPFKDENWENLIPKPGLAWKMPIRLSKLELLLKKL